MQFSRTNPKDQPSSDIDTSSSDESSEEDIEGSDSDSDEKNDYTNAVFAIDHCRHTGSHYAFQMASCKVERHSIRIKTAMPAEPACSCGTPHCHHITWLLEQLSGTSLEDNTNALLTPYEQITACGFDRVCKDLHWELREEADAVPEETRWQLNKDRSSMAGGRRSKMTIKQRMDIVRDIMATMSSKVRDDYRPDVFDSSSNFSRDSIFTPGDLEATISKMLILDDKLLDQFQYIISRDERASDLFIKMELRAKKVCDRLDSFCDVGPISGHSQHDLIWCATMLCNIVTSISHNVTERQPLSSKSREAAAKALVRILSMVVDRNCDIYQNSNIASKRPHNESQRDRNLYLRLIGDPQSSPMGGNFILGALQDLPEAVRYVDELDIILVRLDSVDWTAPKLYRDKLRALISHLKSGSTNSSPSGTAAGKRSAGSLDRMTNKRMK